MSEMLHIPEGTQRNTITSLLRQNDVVTSFYGNNGIFISLRVRWVIISLVKQLYVITDPHPNINSGLAKVLSKLGYWWVIAVIMNYGCNYLSIF